MDQSVVEELKSILEKEFSDYREIAGGKNYRYTHLTTVHKIVKELENKLEADVDSKVLEIGALFHDIGRLEDIENGEMDPMENHDGHAEKGSEIVEDFVSEYVTDSQLNKIKKIIGNHHSSAETVEGKILQDADDLSNFGPSNLWRQFHYACQNGVEREEAIEYFWESAVKDYEEIIKEMYFEHSKEVARRRLEKHKEVFEEIEAETNGEDI